jgi:hypothetical protein
LQAEALSIADNKVSAVMAASATAGAAGFSLVIMVSLLFAKLLDLVCQLDLRMKGISIDTRARYRR